MPSQTEVDAFARAVADHFANPPATWAVAKISDRNWGIAHADGQVSSLDRFTTKQAASDALATGTLSYHAIWEDRDRWYRGNGGHRDRPLESWEVEIIQPYL